VFESGWERRGAPATGKPSERPEPFGCKTPKPKTLIPLNPKTPPPRRARFIDEKGALIPVDKVVREYKDARNRRGAAAPVFLGLATALSPRGGGGAALSPRTDGRRGRRGVPSAGVLTSPGARAPPQPSAPNPNPGA
jgi:hypothetical protein